ncbi:MAG: DUF493 domain-containing protein [Flavobacteriales bacterium]
MNEKENPEDFYKRFKKRLEESVSFPSDYRYKFIVTSDNRKLAEVQKVFDGMRPVISSKESKNGKYTALTIRVYMLDAESVIEKYKQVSEIEGVMML